MIRSASWLILLLILPTHAFAQAGESWIGRRVFVKDGAVAKANEQATNWKKLLEFPSTVEDENGDWLWLGRAWIRKGDVMDLQQAFDFYTSKINSQSRNAAAWCARGAVLQEKGELEKAIRDLDQAIKIDPTFADAFTARGAA